MTISILNGTFVFIKKKLDKPKYYSEKGEQLQKVSEPMAVYNSTVRSAEEYLEMIPEETMRILIDSAIDDYEMGRCTPHSQMDIWVKERMGWK